MKRGWERHLVPDWSWAREFLVVICVLSVYFAVNIGSSDRRDVALRNARDLISLESSLGLFHELDFQLLILDSPAAPVFTAVYIIVHPLTTVGFIAVLFMSKDRRYPYVREVFVIFSLVSFSLFYLYPTAPPRMMSEYGFVDLIHVGAPISYDSELAQIFLNPYAAMPSIHLGYSIIIGAMIFKIFSGRLMVLGISYPLLMFLSIIGSANHLIIDCLASVLILAMIYLLVARLRLPFRLIRIFKGIAGDVYKRLGLD